MNILDGWTQFGIAGVMLGIFYFIIRYFVTSMEKKDKRIIEITEKFITISEKDIESRGKLVQIVDANTQMTKVASEINKQQTDSLTKLVLEVIKTK